MNNSLTVDIYTAKDRAEQMYRCVYAVKESESNIVYTIRVSYSPLISKEVPTASTLIPNDKRTINRDIKNYLKREKSKNSRITHQSKTTHSDIYSFTALKQIIPEAILSKHLPNMMVDSSQGFKNLVFYDDINTDKLKFELDKYANIYGDTFGCFS